MGLGRCIALPSLRDVEYEYGEGSSLREVATGAAASEVAGGAGAGQPPVFFSFNRFDATNPAPADELMASFPRLALHAAGNRAHRERARALFAGELAGAGVSRSRGPLHAHGGLLRRPASVRAVPFALEPDSREAWGAAMDAALAAIGEGRVSKVVLSRRLRLVAEHPFSSKDLLVNLIDGDARGTVLLYRYADVFFLRLHTRASRAQARRCGGVDVSGGDVPCRSYGGGIGRAGRGASGRWEEPRRARLRGAAHSQRS